jgi:uncharacterized protein (TIGR02145 family)
MNKLYSFLFFLLFPLSSLLGQGEFNNWYFGFSSPGAGVNFNSGAPVAIPNGVMWSGSSTISVSDSSGNLLFFSDGTKVYNRNKVIMPNGSGLHGDNLEFRQCVISTSIPGDDSSYYIFTVGGFNPIGTSYGLYYSIINMRLNGGLGDIETGFKNIPIPSAANSWEAVTGSRHKNNNDVWIVTTVSTQTNIQYAAFLINNSGLSATPVLSESNGGGQYSPSPPFNYYVAPSWIRVSPDGTKLVCCWYSCCFEFCTFNPQTGSVNRLFSVQNESANYNTINAEFSIDSKYLYVSQATGGFSTIGSIYQYNSNLFDSAAFIQSKTLIDTGKVRNGLQMGPDWKIYGSESMVDSLAVIQNPSNYGNTCHYQRNAIGLTGLCGDALPQFIQRYKAYIHYTGICQNDSILFTGDIYPPPDSIHWDFGDQSSGSLNFSNALTPAHIYSNTGNFIIKIFVRHNDNRTDTSWQTITILASPSPSLGNNQTICAGSTTTFDAGTCAGCTYLWKDISTGLTVGTGQTLTTGTAGTYAVIVTNGNNCSGSDTVQLTTTPISAVMNSPLSETICSGQSTNVVLIPSVSGATFHWTANLTSGNITGFSADSGTIINQILTNSLSTPGVVTYHITPKVGNCTGATVDYQATVNPGNPVSVSISAPLTSVCAGTLVTFTAIPTYPGANPIYQWQVNGTNQGLNSTTFTWTPLNGDVVTCQLTSSLSVCISNNPATSNAITMVVNTGSAAGVSITTSPNPFCPGSTVICSATPINGGGNPLYQWIVNGINAGINSNTYSFIPNNGDSIRCVMTSNLTCATGSPVSSIKIIMSGSLAPIVTFTSCFDTITTVNATPIKLKGGIPLGGIYSGSGVNSGTGIFTPSIAGTGTKTITYTYTNAALCSAYKTLSIIVMSNPNFTCGGTLTDIRDGKTYPTIQIGSQCWMAANLNFGTILASIQDQRDNCISEKYCYNDNPTNCTSLGGLYQWDELMLYDNTPADQGFCPPGWHIPTENEWNTLFSNYISSAFAANPLKYSGYSGFTALLSGDNYLNKSWNFNGFATFFWSSTAFDSLKAWAHGINDPDPSISAYPALKTDAFSVRCVK